MVIVKENSCQVEHLEKKSEHLTATNIAAKFLKIAAVEALDAHHNRNRKGYFFKSSVNDSNSVRIRSAVL